MILIGLAFATVSVSALLVLARLSLPALLTIPGGVLAEIEVKRALAAARWRDGEAAKQPDSDAGVADRARYARGTLERLLRGRPESSRIHRALELRHAFQWIMAQEWKTDNDGMKPLASEVYPRVVYELLHLIEKSAQVIRPSTAHRPPCMAADEILTQLMEFRRSEAGHRADEEAFVGDRNLVKSCENFFRTSPASIEQMLELLTVVLILSEWRIDYQQSKMV